MKKTGAKPRSPPTCEVVGVNSKEQARRGPDLLRLLTIGWFLAGGYRGLVGLPVARSGVARAYLYRRADPGRSRAQRKGEERQYEPPKRQGVDVLFNLCALLWLPGVSWARIRGL